MSSWLENLKPGDLVAIPVEYTRRHEVRKIDRLTATQIVVGHSKFRRNDGRLVGGSSWRSFYLREPTYEIIVAARAHEARELLGSIARGATPCDDETLSRMVEVYRQAKAEKPHA